MHIDYVDSRIAVIMVKELVIVSLEGIGCAKIMNDRLYMTLAVDRVGFVQFHYLQSPILVHLQLSRHMGKPTSCIGENSRRSASQ